MIKFNKTITGLKSLSGKVKKYIDDPSVKEAMKEYEQVIAGL